MPKSSAHSPFRDGFAALRHEPALFAAELAWRWCFGLAAWGLTIISAILFLDSLKISHSDEFLLGSLQPRLLDVALRHIFRGSLDRLLLEQAVLVLGLILLWAFAATAGRAATLRRLVAMFSTEEEPQVMRWEFEPIFMLNLLRAMWSLIALAAVLISLGGGNDHGHQSAGVESSILACLWGRLGVDTRSDAELVLRIGAALLHSKRRTSRRCARPIHGFLFPAGWPLIGTGDWICGPSRGLGGNNVSCRASSSEAGTSSRFWLDRPDHGDHHADLFRGS